MLRPIVFIHGFGGGRYEFQPIIRFLRKKGFKKFYEFTYKGGCGQISINTLTKKFAKFVGQRVKEKDISIIGISQGGIIARLYIKRYKSKKIKKCVTLCAPHKGSLIAYFLNLPGFVDLRPNSKLLRDLNSHNKDNVSYYSIYAPFDLMVFPGWNAKFNNAQQNKMVLAPLHLLAFWWPSTLRFVLDSLNQS